jgi:hypothetical protein
VRQNVAPVFRRIEGRSAAVMVGCRPFEVGGVHQVATISRNRRGDASVPNSSRWHRPTWPGWDRALPPGTYEGPQCGLPPRAAVAVLYDLRLRSNALSHLVLHPDIGRLLFHNCACEVHRVRCPDKRTRAFKRPLPSLQCPFYDAGHRVSRTHVMLPSDARSSQQAARRVGPRGRRMSLDDSRTGNLGEPRLFFPNPMLPLGWPKSARNRFSGLSRVVWTHFSDGLTRRRQHRPADQPSPTQYVCCISYRVARSRRSATRLPLCGQWRAGLMWPAST